MRFCICDGAPLLLGQHVTSYLLHRCGRATGGSCRPAREVTYQSNRKSGPGGADTPRGPAETYVGGHDNARLPAPETRQSSQLHFVDRSSSTSAPFVDGNGVLDQLLGQLAEFVAERVAARLTTPQHARRDEWLDTRRAAEYLGIGRDSLRRLAAERAIPTEQAGAGRKLYFRRSDLDHWRCSGSVPVIAGEGWRHG